MGNTSNPTVETEVPIPGLNLSSTKIVFDIFEISEARPFSTVWLADRSFANGARRATTYPERPKAIGSESSAQAGKDIGLGMRFVCFNDILPKDNNP